MIQVKQFRFNSCSVKKTKIIFQGCYNKSITYIDGGMSNDKKEIAMEQIVSLIQLSERCEQSFQYDCLLAPLTNNDVDLAYWEDRNKEINNYYTGRKFTCIHPIVDFGTCFNTGIRAGSNHFYFRIQQKLACL